MLWEVYGVHIFKRSSLTQFFDRYCIHIFLTAYCITGIFGGHFNLAVCGSVWRISILSPN